MLRKWGMIALILLATPALVFAQNTGKIAGLVTDADTGDPLPGATVILASTTLGTITDVDGNYFIIGVPVGAYDVQASFVGYANATVLGVEVSSGYTREINFSLSPGVELDEIIIEYERPLIQKDAIGVPKIVSAEEIISLPVRGSAEIAKIQAGVVADEGSGTLHIRGGRGAEVTYYIDGVKVFGNRGIPQSAVQEQEMLIGSINARYGDAMSGIINITTKSGSTKFFGSFEGITSEAFDDFGYNLLSGTIGGPVVGGKLNFFLSGEYFSQADNNPRAFGELRIHDDVIADLDAFPTGFNISNADGATSLLNIPASLSDGAYLLMDSDGNVVMNDGNVTFMVDDANGVATVDTQIPIAEGFSLDSFTPQNRSRLMTRDDYSVVDKKENRESNGLSGTGNLTFNVLDNARIRVGGRFRTRDDDGGLSNRDILVRKGKQRSESSSYQIYGSWTHYLSNNTFYTLQVDYSDNNSESWDPTFGRSRDDMFRYADVDGEDAYSTVNGYKNVSLVERQIADSDGDLHAVQVPTYSNIYTDGQGLPSGSDVIFTLIQTAGREFRSYGKSRSEQFRFTASATTQIGLHQLEFGGEYETRTSRSFSINPTVLSRYFNDGNADRAINDDRVPDEGFTRWDELPNWLVDNVSSTRGYDLRGEKETDSESLTGFIDTDIEKAATDYQLAPYEPIYYGGYVQDKIEFRDIVLNLGLRVDVFDNNQRVLIDKFARRPVLRAGDLNPGEFNVPSSIGDDYAVYFSGNDIVGYRSIKGDFFDAIGNSANAGEISFAGKPTQLSNQIREDMFEDYDPQVTVMPRIGVSFPITDQALFFASYGVVAQRPSSRVDLTLSAVSGTGGINNSGLVPEKTTNYELGFRQRLGARAAFTISGFFKQIENLIQRRELRFATPNVYSQAQNVDFGTVKGVEFGFDLRRTNNLSINANYTLSWADGTGSGSNTTSTIIWVSETPPNFISALDFDQRHRINVSLDYRFGEGEGPTLLGGKLFQNTGINILFTANSGSPYTAVSFPENLAGGAKPEQPRGTINGDYADGQSRVDFRLDRRFNVGNTQLSAFIWVQNLFDQTNVNDVWRFTGLANNDGFLSTDEGLAFVAGASNPTLAEDLYNHRNRIWSWVGLPRLTRIGVRLDF